MVAGGLGCGIRTRRIVRSVFPEQALGAQRAVDFVGTHVVEQVLFVARKRSERFEQVEGAGDVSPYERLGSQYAAIDVTLGGEVNHGLRGLFLENRLDLTSLCDVDSLEAVVLLVFDRGQIGEVCRIRQGVYIDEVVLRVSGHHQA